MKSNLRKNFLSLLLVYSLLILSLPSGVLGQAAGSQTASSAPESLYAAALSRIEEKTEARRKELGIPGMSLVIVKDDQVIYMKGLGYKDFEKKVDVTPDTQFAIGSSTKAFTALSVLMSQDEGKISLDDSPKKVLPYFKINDPEIDKAITIRDLLNHGSGLNRTDLGWITGKLNREEIIRVAGEAKPTAKLREKFQYQNVMYAAAGEIVAKVQKQPWEKYVVERVFKPLGMTNSTMSMTDMAKAEDHSFGYDYNFDTKETQQRPFRDLTEIAPAGNINSSAKDMAQWLRLVLGGGVIDGKRLVSEKSFEEWLKPQMKISPNGKNAYGLGWFIQEWNGLKVVQHGGNIDGFNALVAMVPEKKLGFVMLTNVSGSSLGGELMPIVWSNILGTPETPSASGTAASSPIEKEVGQYKFEAAGFNVEVKLQDGGLVAIVPQQPIYKLENVGGRKYKLNGAPQGFFITFRDAEAYLEQPQGNYTLPRLKNGESSGPKASEAAKELIGKYESEVSGSVAEIKEVDGKVSMVLTGQQPYALVDKQKDQFSMSPLPDTFSLKVVRNDAGKVTKVVVAQPEGEFGFKSLAEAKPAITIDELMSKVVAAHGGDANWRKLTTRVSKFEIDMEHQGVKAVGTAYAKAPNKSATETTLTALGKKIASGWDYFDGTGGEEAYTFAPTDKYTGKRLEDVRLGADFHSLLNWKNNYKKAELVRVAKCGDEQCYEVVFEPENGTKFTEYYSTATFLQLKRQGVQVSSTSSMQIPYTVVYSDYREVDGVKIPFKTVSSSVSNGNVITYLKEVKHNVTVNDAIFAPRKLQ